MDYAEVNENLIFELSFIIVWIQMKTKMVNDRVVCVRQSQPSPCSVLSNHAHNLLQ